MPTEGTHTEFPEVQEASLLHPEVPVVQEVQEVHLEGHVGRQEVQDIQDIHQEDQGIHQGIQGSDLEVLEGPEVLVVQRDQGMGQKDDQS